MRELDHLKDIIPNYDYFIIDLWGVVHNGIQPYKGAVETIQELHNNKIRVSLFVNPSKETLENLGIIATDRVELYTYHYAHNYSKNKSEAIKSYVEVYQFIQNEFPKIEFNAGHDLNLENLEYFLRSITNIKEVSIGHALICDTFEFGLEKTIKKYLEITSKL